jgi:hypothetical protein
MKLKIVLNVMVKNANKLNAMVKIAIIMNVKARIVKF